MIDAKPDLNRSKIARYVQLATLFRRFVETGQWALGQQIPTVDELADELQVARATIRQALGQLEAEGLISRFRAKGTFVNKRPTAPVWCEVHTDWNGLLTAREGASIAVLADYEHVALPPINFEGGARSPGYRYLKRQHTRDGKPFLIAELYIDEKLAQKIPPAYFTEKTALRLVSSIPGVKIASAQQIFTIGTADPVTAEALDIAMNAPVCYVDRFAVDQRGRLVLVAKGIYRGDAIHMKINLK